MIGIIREITGIIKVIEGHIKNGSTIILKLRRDWGREEQRGGREQGERGEERREGKLECLFTSTYSSHSVGNFGLSVPSFALFSTHFLMD